MGMGQKFVHLKVHGMVASNSNGGWERGKNQCSITVKLQVYKQLNLHTMPDLTTGSFRFPLKGLAKLEINCTVDAILLSQPFLGRLNIGSRYLYLAYFYMAVKGY